MRAEAQRIKDRMDAATTGEEAKALLKEIDALFARYGPVDEIALETSRLYMMAGGIPDDEEPEPVNASTADTLDVVDLHLPGRHLQKSHGSWAKSNPFHKSHRRMNMKYINTKGLRGGESGGSGKGSSKSTGDVGTKAKPSKKPVFRVEAMGARNGAEVYNNPDAVGGNRVTFVGSTKGGEKRGFFANSDGALPSRQDMAYKGLDQNISETLSGIYYRDTNTLLADNGMFDKTAPLSDDDRAFLLEAFPDVKHALINGDRFVVKDGEFVEPFNPKPTTMHGNRAVYEMQDITGLRSNWSHFFARDDEVPEDSRKTAAGVKLWSCDIWIDKNSANSLGGAKVLVHELFHSFSPDLNPRDYVANRGWEEGVVEKMSQLYEEPIIRSMYPDADEADIQSMLGQGKTYQEYIHPLELLRTALGEDEKPFYTELFRVPLRRRSDHIEGKLKALRENNASSAELEGLFVYVDDILKGKA